MISVADQQRGGPHEKCGLAPEQEVNTIGKR